MQKQERLLSEDKQKYYIILILTILFAVNLNAAEIYMVRDTVNKKTDTMYYRFPKNQIFLEIFGITGAYSLNYERLVFKKNNNSITLRAGFCEIPVMGYVRIYPVVVNYNSFIVKRLIFNLGIGIGYWDGVDYSQSSTTYDNGLYYISNIGITYIPIRWLILKFSVTPKLDNCFSTYSPMTFLGGSIGIKF